MEFAERSRRFSCRENRPEPASLEKLTGIYVCLSLYAIVKKFCGAGSPSLWSLVRMIRYGSHQRREIFEAFNIVLGYFTLL